MATIKLAREALLRGSDTVTPVDISRAFVSYAAKSNEKIQLEEHDDSGFSRWKTPSEILQISW